MTERRALLAEQQLMQGRQHLLDREHELARERVDLAQNAAGSVQAMSERMLEADQSRHAQLMEQERARTEATMAHTQQFFAGQLESVRSDRELANDRSRADMERERQRYGLEPSTNASSSGSGRSGTAVWTASARTTRTGAGARSRGSPPRKASVAASTNYG